LHTGSFVGIVICGMRFSGTTHIYCGISPTPTTMAESPRPVCRVSECSVFPLASILRIDLLTLYFSPTPTIMAESLRPVCRTSECPVLSFAPDQSTVARPTFLANANNDRVAECPVFFLASILRVDSLILYFSPTPSILVESLWPVWGGFDE